MNPTTRMLLWREWHERRTLFAGCLIWMLGGTVYSIAYQFSTGYPAAVASFASTVLLYGMFAPIFLAMRTARAEMTNHSRAFSDGLPVSPHTRGLIRLLGGLAALVVPIVAGAILYTPVLAFGWLEQAPLREIRAEYITLLERGILPATGAVGLLWCVVAISSAAASLLYLLLATLGTRLASEAHVGFVGAALAWAWLLYYGAATSLETDQPSLSTYTVGGMVPQSLAQFYSYGTETGYYGDLMLAPRVAVPLAINLVVQVLLALVFVRSYARQPRLAEGPRGRLALPRLWRWQPPLPTRGAALVWITLRQALPLCLPGLAIAAVIAWFEMRKVIGLESYAAHGPWQVFANRLPHGVFIIGMLWGAVVGSGTFAADMDRRTGEFWRALPVPYSGWFLTKYFVGLLAVLAVLDGAAVAAGWNSPQFGEYDSMNWPYVFCIIPLHATLFSLAAAWACTLRRPVIGAFAALATLMLANLALSWSPATRPFDPIEVYNGLFSNRVNFDPDVAYRRLQITSAAMLAVFLASLAVAWHGLRRYQADQPDG